MSRKSKKTLDLSVVSKDVDFDKAMEEKTVLNGIVMRTEKTEGGTAVVVQVDNKNIIVTKNQVGHLPGKKKLGDIVGTNLYVVLTAKENDNTYYGSYTEACTIMAQPILDQLKNGEAVEAVVRHLEPFGAFVTVSQGITALIRNTDAVTGSGYASDYLEVGTTVKVKLKSIAEDSNRIYVELLDKIETPDIVPEGVEKINVTKGQVFMGKVKKANTQIVVVDIGGGLEGTAKPQRDMKIVDNANVRYRVLNVSKNGAIIGHILSVL